MLGLDALAVRTTLARLQVYVKFALCVGVSRGGDGAVSHCETWPGRGLTLEHMYGNIDAFVEERMQGMAGKNDGAAREIRGAVIMVIGLGLMFIPITLALLGRL